MLHYSQQFSVTGSESKDKAKGLSKGGSKAQSRDGSRPPSAIENHIDYFKEPVVKVGYQEDKSLPY